MPLSEQHHVPGPTEERAQLVSCLGLRDSCTGVHIECCLWSILMSSLNDDRVGFSGNIWPREVRSGAECNLQKRLCSSFTGLFVSKRSVNRNIGY